MAPGKLDDVRVSAEGAPPERRRAADLELVPKGGLEIRHGAARALDAGDRLPLVLVLAALCALCVRAVAALRGSVGVHHGRGHGHGRSVVPVLLRARHEHVHLKHVHDVDAGGLYPLQLHPAPAHGHDLRPPRRRDAVRGHDLALLPELGPADVVARAHAEAVLRTRVEVRHVRGVVDARGHLLPRPEVRARPDVVQVHDGAVGLRRRPRQEDALARAQRQVGAGEAGRGRLVLDRLEDAADHGVGPRLPPRLAVHGAHADLVLHARVQPGQRVLHGVLVQLLVERLLALLLRVHRLV
mmetsp:Transcript_9210/g.26915  ORF Transcript_9210/g.26915 Transcript_9210/m.26915 type:complete len:298 (-) Transcript_9210:2382-3275(-)